ncbi:Retinol dehydrogenase 14, partial [Armadillidium nasatum]
VVVITGANSGIGKETARELAKRGAVVVLACRNKSAAQEAVKDIRTTTGDGDLIIFDLDLANLSSVKECANKIIEKFQHIDVLINNAGVAYPSDSDVVTSDGYEIHFGVNHLGHFLFTNILLERIKETQGSRIIIVSSSLHKHGVIDFETLSSPEKSKELLKNRKHRNPFYSDSKLCNILHGQELKRRLAGTGTGVYVLFPGFVYTGLFRYSLPKYNWIQKLCFLPIAYLFLRSPKQGAQTSVYCAVSKELNGIPFGILKDCKMAEVLSPLASDESLATQLWNFSASLVEKFS